MQQMIEILSGAAVVFIAGMMFVWGTGAVQSHWTKKLRLRHPDSTVFPSFRYKTLWAALKLANQPSLPIYFYPLFDRRGLEVRAGRPYFEAVCVISWDEIEAINAVTVWTGRRQAQCLRVSVLLGNVRHNLDLPVLGRGFSNGATISVKDNEQLARQVRAHRSTASNPPAG